MLAQRTNLFVPYAFQNARHAKLSSHAKLMFNWVRKTDETTFMMIPRSSRILLSENKCAYPANLEEAW
jgi:hypothetical protein